MAARVDNARRKIEIVDVSHSERQNSSDKQIVTDEDIRDILRVLNKQAQGVKVLQVSLQDSTRQALVMDRELQVL